MKNLFYTLIATTAVFVPAHADILSITGSIEVSGFPGNIAFYPLGGPSGKFSVQPPDTGAFAGLGGSSGAILDLNTATEPINTPLNIPDFMTFAGAPNLSFTLTELLGGSSPACAIPPSLPAPGQACSPTGTPYNLTNFTANSSTASFAVDGFVIDSNNPSVQTAFSGVFSTPFVNESFQQVLEAVLSGGKVDATYSAQFTTSPVTGTPEPGTIFTLCAGGLLMLGFGKLRSRNAR